jgi:hypothetical protein
MPLEMSAREDARKFPVRLDVLMGVGKRQKADGRERGTLSPTSLRLVTR